MTDKPTSAPKDAPGDVAGELESALCAPTWGASLGHVHNALAALSAPQHSAEQSMRPMTFAPPGLEYAAVDQHDVWLLRFADQDRGDQWFGGADYTAEETRAFAIKAWNRYAPAWSVRLMRTVTLDEVRSLETTPQPAGDAGETERTTDAR